MIIGVPKEVKSDEYRVALLPVGAQLLVRDGHTVLIEQNAGIESGYPDDDYIREGAQIVERAEDVYGQAELVVKVKEPQPAEIAMLRSGQVLFCYFHFASSRELTRGCLDAGIAAVAYETLVDTKGRLPLLTPMSEVAGKMSVQEGAKCLEKHRNGRGLLLGGVAGVKPANVVILGGGVVGTNAAWVAAGMGAAVIIMDIHLDRLRYLEEVMPANVTTVFSDPHAIAYHTKYADLVIGSVLIPGEKAPVLISREIVQTMKRGAVLVDVAIDQGGCFETSRPTTHGNPSYVVDDVVHYCVANIPGAVSRTSSQALCHATLPYCRELAARGLDGFLGKSDGYRAALNMRDGKITHEGVADAFPELR
ncbi:MAG: alanine dehydrogenase [Deltaproteobacteria bacterium]|nr:alanine dehydrogenase [Deltaproteobacteria bacterium]MBN2670662.1 alanine dehydrogenase [Deltaproteobacteria bacterium]